MLLATPKRIVCRTVASPSSLQQMCYADVLRPDCTTINESVIGLMHHHKQLCNRLMVKRLSWSWPWGIIHGSIESDLEDGCVCMGNCVCVHAYSWFKMLYKNSHQSRCLNVCMYTRALALRAHHAARPAVREHAYT
eukprot:1136293-Pelagomonas_calceolata.AAC.1